MFIFYYAVLSEVSPPTALSPFAAAAITGGGPYRTTMQCWKYTTPAFLIPFMFVLDPSGTGLLLTGSFKTLGEADWGSILRVTIAAGFGVVALAGGSQGWLFHKTTILERWLLIIADVLLVYPAALCDYIGAAMIGITVVLQKLRGARIKAAAAVMVAERRHAKMNVMGSRTRNVDRMLDRYGEFHRNPANKAIHWVCVPLIVWSVLGMLWGASPAAAYIAIGATMVFYVWLSLPLALGMLGVIALMVWPLTLLGSRALIVSIAVFVAAWIGQFIGHIVEGRKPAFLEDVRSLLIGPAWLLADLYRRLGIAY